MNLVETCECTPLSTLSVLGKDTAVVLLDKKHLLLALQDHHKAA